MYTTFYIKVFLENEIVGNELQNPYTSFGANNLAGKNAALTNSLLLPPISFDPASSLIVNQPAVSSSMQS